MTVTFDPHCRKEKNMTLLRKRCALTGRSTVPAASPLMRYAPRNQNYNFLTGRVAHLNKQGKRTALFSGSESKTSPHSRGLRPPDPLVQNILQEGDLYKRKTTERKKTDNYDPARSAGKRQNRAACQTVRAERYRVSHITRHGL